MHTFSSAFRIFRFNVLRLAVTVLAGASLILAPGVAQAAGASVLRDAEIETIIRSYADPLFRASGIPPESIRIRILEDETLNAFVTSGNRMFIHSGLLMKTETPLQLIGVIAHETGHIAGGHIARMGPELEKAMMTSLLATALGVVAGVASGRADAGMAAMTLGGTVAERTFFAFTRTQENSADAFAMKVLDSTNQSAQGLLEFFHTLQGQEMLVAARQDPYVRTHPLTEDRISAIENHVEQKNISDRVPSQQQATHDRMVAKLFAFLNGQGRTLQKYPETDQSLSARYARAIAYYRRGDMAKALPEIDGLIREYPKDPYFHELRGQMLVENTRITEGLPSYRIAVSLAPNAPLIGISYGHALVESDIPANWTEAQTVLRRALSQEPDHAFGWRMLGNAYGKAGDETRAAYAMAEYALLIGDRSQARFQAAKAEKGLKQSDPMWLRLQDIKTHAKPDEEK